VGGGRGARKGVELCYGEGHQIVTVQLNDCLC
jgi:hypothetical protein